ncbi:class I SAM-dependent methyltransferase [Spirosoma fluviale]|uniref:Predicted O-methyltransferase YrrM n=1 Tax=Spirosoma fluviale TaxID=1597977 RepID=A0A286GVL6_9BACT|nr:class I SAM-dependent methyltransferase [Spirosoma fluviale]SOD99149.1 Predicted O-methyltransferase YrrM [Spirosoma fluviale]
MKFYTQLDDQLYKYVIANSLREPEAARLLREEVAGMRMSSMQSPPDQCQFLYFLLQMMQAKRTIEIGTFAGYFTLWTALALPEQGRIIACDVEPNWPDVGRKYWKKAYVDHKIDLRIAPALQTLQELIEQKHFNLYDFIFIDADKDNYVNYYNLALQLLRPGGLIAIDNTLWNGTVINPAVQSSDVLTIRNLNEHLRNDDRIHLSMLTIGDGLTLVVKK